MVVVIHEHVSMHFQPIPRAHAAQKLHDMNAVTDITEDRFPRDSAIDHVIPAALMLDP